MKGMLALAHVNPYITSLVGMLQILSNAVHSTVAPLIDAASEAAGAALAVKAMLNHESRLELSVLILQSYNLSQSQHCAVA